MAHLLYYFSNNSLRTTAKQEKKGETRNRHYVPQFYQRYSSIGNKNIGACVINCGKNILSALIKTQSSGDYFYSENMGIEHTPGGMEGLAKGVIDKIIANPKGHLTREEQYTLYSFTMMREGRTLAHASLIQEHADTVLRNLIKKQIELSRNNGNATEVEGITNEVPDRCSFNLRQPGIFAPGTQAQLINTCIDLKYKVLINNTKIPSVTSNNPAAIYDRFMEHMGNQVYALGSGGLQIYLPLTPTLGVMLYDSKCYRLGDRKKTYVEILNDKNIKGLNKLTAPNAEDITHYKPKSITKNELEQFANQDRKFKSATRVESYPEVKTSNGVIVGTCNISMFCRLTSSFIKELPRYESIRPQDYDPTQHKLREIVYFRDDIIRMSSK